MIFLRPLGAAAALVAMQGAARAQVIDQYLDPNIPGYGAAPGVTVAGRAQPEYDAMGVRVGAFTLMPTLDEYAGYDSNVTGTTNGRGSPLIETNGRVEAADQMSNASLGASVSVDDWQYPSQSSQSYTNWTGSAGGSYNFGRDTLTIAASHLNLYQTPRDLDAPALQSALGYRVNDVRVNYTIDLGHINIQPAFDVSWYGYDNGIVNNQAYLQSFRDRVVYEPSVTAGYEFATRRRLVVIIRDADAQYSGAPPAPFPRQNFNDISVLAGVSYDTDGVIGLRVLAGYEARNFSASYYKAIRAPIAEAGFTWTPTGLTTLTGTVGRYIEDSAAEATIGYTETSFKLNLDHELYRNIILNANGAFFNDDYAQSAGSQDYYQVGVGATWKLDRNFRLSADYTYSSRETSNATNFADAVEIPSGGVFGSSYSESVFRVHLRVAI